MLWLLGILICILFCLLFLTLTKLRRLNDENRRLQLQLEKAAVRIAELEMSRKAGGLFEKTVTALVGLGTPGLLLLAAMSTSGFAGGAAITTALATLGMGTGMIGGIAALVALGLASKALAEYGYPKLADAVVCGLISKGKSKEEIRQTVSSVPQLILPSKARSKILAALEAGE